MLRAVSKFNFLVSVVLLILFSGLMELRAENSDKILAVVNKEIITQSELDEIVSILAMDLKVKDEKQREKAILQLKDEVLGRLIEDKLILSVAKNNNITVEAAEINARLEEIKRNFGSEQDFNEYLSTRGLTVGDIKRRLNEQLMIQKIMDGAIKSGITVDPEEITDYYEFHRQNFIKPEERDVSLIFIAKEGIGEAEFSKKVNTVLKKLREKEDFKSVQEKFSDRDNLGLVAKGSLIKSVDEKIFSLAKGVISEPLILDDGVYIFKVEEIIPGSAMTLNEAQDEIYNIIFNQKADERFSKWMDNVKKNSYIEIKK